MASSLMRAFTSEPALPHVDIAKERRKYVARNECRTLFFFRSIASVRGFAAWRVALSKFELIQGLTLVI